MRIVGIALLVFVLWFGLQEREQAALSIFDLHALVMVFVGSIAAVLTSSKTTTLVRTLLCVGEFLPGLGRLERETKQLEEERKQFCALWLEGKRGSAVQLAEGSSLEATKHMLRLLVNRAPEEATQNAFLALRHEETAAWQPAIQNWELLAKLAPAFGMAGTITGMVSMFRNMNSDNLNIGSSMSLALISTLYGVAFGSGIAGPIAHYLNGLLDDRLGVLERCEMTVNELVSLSGR